ncbi:MAG: membrane protein insertion efficiency factor YidD [Spirochaetaceae bacterium]
MLRRILRLPRYFLLIPIYLYRKTISPLMPPHCIYHPSCSSYAFHAVREHGLIKGGILATARVIRCSALFTGGYDAVPEEFSFRYIGESYRRFWSRRADTTE